MLAFVVGCAEDIRDVLGELPPANLATLRYICRYLLLVASHEHENRMSIQNLARVFAPNIFRCPSEPPEGTLPSAEHLAYLAETLVVGKILQFILEHFDEVFGAVGDWYVGWASLFSAGGLVRLSKCNTYGDPIVILIGGDACRSRPQSGFP